MRKRIWIKLEPEFDGYWTITYGNSIRGDENGICLTGKTTSDVVELIDALVMGGEEGPKNA